MSKKIVFLFLIFLASFTLITQAKYSLEKEILIANINIDTISPKIELMNIKNVSYKEDNKELYNINIQIKVIESNIKVNNINSIQVKIDNVENKNNYAINKIENIDNEIIYEIIIKNLLKNQKIKILIPEGIVIDNSNNTNNEQIIDYEIE